jgi:hypothetical protein
MEGCEMSLEDYFKAVLPLPKKTKNNLLSERKTNMRKILTTNVYKTKSAIWSYNQRKKKVSLLVVNSDGMTNDLIEYRPHNKHYEKHRNRIKRIAG